MAVMGIDILTARMGGCVYRGQNQRRCKQVRYHGRRHEPLSVVAVTVAKR